VAVTEPTEPVAFIESTGGAGVVIGGFVKRRVTQLFAERFVRGFADCFLELFLRKIP
jgi:hypothetical protein